MNLIPKFGEHEYNTKHWNLNKQGWQQPNFKIHENFNKYLSFLFKAKDLGICSDLQLMFDCNDGFRLLFNYKHIFKMLNITKNISNILF